MTLPLSVHESLRAKYNPDGADLRRAQLRMLEMLRFLDRVCRENGIKYWIDYGTLLGAVRHDGFIPWDDDTDVCMMWEDAQAFKRLMLSGAYGDEFVLQCRETDDGYFGSWLVLRDTRSEYVQDSEVHKKRQYRGLQVDIFIYDDKTVQLFLDITKLIHRDLVHRPLREIPDREKAIRRARPWAFLLYDVLVPIMRFLSPRRNYIAPCYGTWFIVDRTPKEMIFPLGTVRFEGYEFSCPGRKEDELALWYGDWQQLPERIETHNVTFIFKES